MTSSSTTDHAPENPMGPAIFGLHSFPGDPDWKGWWGDQPPFGSPVYVLTHTAPRPSLSLRGGTTFHFRNTAIEDVLAEATEAASGVDAPILLGRGNLLWDNLGGLELTHRVTSEVAESGTIHVTFTP